jgi:glycine cleavage system transcriptional repressor
MARIMAAAIYSSGRRIGAMSTFALSAMGADRPGIVAAIAETLVAHGVNVTDSHMGILRGHFAMTLIVETEAEVAVLEADLQAVGRELGLEAVTLAPVQDSAAHREEPTHTVTVYGADHPGIVAAVTTALAHAGVNVTDLLTRLSGDLYVMFIEVAAPGGLPDLEAVAREQGVEISVQPLETDVL